MHPREIVLAILLCCGASASKAQEPSATSRYLGDLSDATTPGSIAWPAPNAESTLPDLASIGRGALPGRPSFLVMPKPIVARPRFAGKFPRDTGWWTRLHLMAEIYDGYTTKMTVPQIGSGRGPHFAHVHRFPRFSLAHGRFWHTGGWIGGRTSEQETAQAYASSPDRTTCICGFQKPGLLL